MIVQIKYSKEEYLFFSYFALVTIGKSFSFNANSIELQTISVIAIVLLIVKLYNTKFTPKELILVTILGILGLIVYYSTKREGILLSIITIIGLKGIPYRKLFSMVFQIKLIIYVTLISLAFIGIIPNVKYQQWREGIGFVTRYGMGYEHPNLLHTNLFLLVILYIYLKYEKLKLKNLICIMIINAVIYKFSYSRTGYYSICLIIIGTLLIKSRICSKLTNLLLRLALPGSIMFTILTAFLYGRVRMINQLDRLFTGRIYYSNHFLTQYPINLFGYDLSYDSHLLDNGYVILLINYGVVVFFLYVVGYLFLIRRFAQKNMIKELFMISSFTLYGVAEGYISNIFLNFSLLFLGDLLFHNFIKREENSAELINKREVLQ